ncbi:phospholipid-binding protein MlaC [Magnetospirillum sp. SS-4]|uniref:MlaC/ttg2D family ABC transporter substrate-binding protein n=1 Tax=Magnetospirillum sp. SS-4 TaxID=2681465 RepID=UPI001385D773|nr:ABC transporter substrate-binding protein [Magnetospirillum sp. SS-4]CAA7620406.1 conserved exported hypothetical protein [Magnetospirillum sp. SS-4]
MTASRLLAALTLSLLVTVLPLRPAGAGDARTARDAVQAAVGEGLDTFVAKGHSLAERTRLLDGLLRRHSDPSMLSSYILGRHWGKLEAAERTAFSDVFMRYLVSSYVGLLKNLKTGVAVQVGDARPVDGRFRVASMVTLPSQPSIPIPVDWDVVDAPDGRPVIIDVTAEGVSIIRAMREDFASVLRNSGGRIEPLMEALGRKITTNDASNTQQQ